MCYTNQNAFYKNNIPDCVSRVLKFKMAEREIVIRGRRLSQLKVDELKQELELRGLRKSGNKGVLIERLQEVISRFKCFFSRKVDVVLARLPWPCDLFYGEK